MRQILAAAFAMCTIPELGASQAVPAEQRQFLEFATRVVAADLQSGKFGSLRTDVDSLPWRVRGPNIDSTSSITFERAILHAVAGQRANARDSMAMNFAGSVTVSATQADLRVDFGSIWCTRGMPMESGTYYSYTFIRQKDTWALVERRPTLSYDPPPAPRDSVPGDQCARAIAP